jgi:hypothetical protein
MHMYIYIERTWSERIMVRSFEKRWQIITVFYPGYIVVSSNKWILDQTERFLN